MDWQPIETAPKDGTPILVCSMDGTRNIVQWARFEGGPGVSSRAVQVRNWQICGDEDGVIDEGWDQGAGWFMEPHSPPTHWMPLPAPAVQTIMEGK